MQQLAIEEAFRPPNTTCRLHLVPAPAGITADVLEGRAGWFLQHRRRLIYLKRGRRVCWFQWVERQLQFTFPEFVV